MIKRENHMEILHRKTLLIIAAAFALFALFLFGMSGLGVILLSGIVFILPVYLILDNFELSLTEKVFFSLFLGLVLVPVPVYWLGTFLSFRLSIALSLLLLLGLGLLLRKVKSGKHHEQGNEPDVPSDVEAKQP